MHIVMPGKCNPFMGFDVSITVTVGLFEKCCHNRNINVTQKIIANVQTWILNMCTQIILLIDIGSNSWRKRNMRKPHSPCTKPFYPKSIRLLLCIESHAILYVRSNLGTIVLRFRKKFLHILGECVWKENVCRYKNCVSSSSVTIELSNCK